MLFGEHAVLQKKHALVSAIDTRLCVSLNARQDDTIKINSSLGSYETSRFDVPTSPPFTFVCDAIRSMQNQISSGFDLEITSEMSPLFGLGTSSAITVATHAALLVWLDGNYTKEMLFEKSLQTIHAVQKRGSGADVAASIYGGIVLYRVEPRLIEPIEACFDLSVVYSKSKMPTPHVVQKVLDAQNKHPDLFALLFEAMDKITLEAVLSIKAGDQETLGALFSMHQGLQDALGVNTLELSEIIYTLRQDPNIFGAKISGSGLGDCAIGLGKTKRQIKDYPMLNIQMSKEGVRVE